MKSIVIPIFSGKQPSAQWSCVQFWHFYFLTRDIITHRIEYLLFHMVCIDINFSVITSSYIYDWVNTSAGGVLIPKGIIRPVVNASALTWFSRYIYYWNLQFLNNVIINKTKVLLPQAHVTLADYYLVFESFDFVRTWWRLFQKRVVCTKLDIYVFIIQTYLQGLEAVKELHHIFNLLELPRNY